MTPSPLPTPIDLGIVLHDATADTARPTVPLAELVRVALRRNPKRAHLLVSTVLAKHVPTVPSVALAAGEALGALVADVLDRSEGLVDRSARFDQDVADRLAALLRTDVATGDAAAGDPAARTASDAVHRAASALRTDLGARRSDHPGVLVLGFAETATALGALVAEALGAPSLHSTRHDPVGARPAAGFDEAHSHATAHRLLPSDPEWLPVDGTVVLVDDELSTGATARATVRALHAVRPQRRWVIASLVDLRSPADVSATEALAAELDAEVTVVALGRGTVDLPAGLIDTAAALVRSHAVDVTGAVDVADAADLTDVADLTAAAGLTAAADLTDAAHVTDGTRRAGRADGAEPHRASRPTDESTRADLRIPPTTVDRFGVPAGRSRTPRTDVEGAAADLARLLGDTPGRVLLLGTEEHMHTPLAIADALRRTGVDVRFSTTTRSPIAVLDDPAWPIRSGVRFRSHDRTVDGPGVRFAYNVHGFDTVVVVPEPGTDRAALEGGDGLLAVLGAVSPRVVLVESQLARPDLPTRRDAAPPSGRDAASPGARDTGSATGSDDAAEAARPLTGPSFGSYEPDDVTWLLQDLADLALEADTADRERGIQLDGANYAESLPVEYVPSPAYEVLYQEALTRSADRVAEAVGIVTERVLADRDHPVLVSLARAGTPIGILMRRWAAQHHGRTLPHLTASIVRGVGIDETALRWLAAHHDPADVVFVDGWTGKGAITRELADALDRFAATDGVRFSADLAVLADPAGCTVLHGTRDDYLVPSACLNSTVSGLVSRTVFNRAVTPEGTLHGAKQYRELSDRDHSRSYVTTIQARFDAVRPRVEATLADQTAATIADRAVDWRGMRTVEAIGAEFGIEDLHLVKPGVGETTRVLLRRVPWQVLVRDPDDVDVAHVVALARERDVPVVVRPDLAYSCVGLIHPLGSRIVEPAAVGAATASAATPATADTDSADTAGGASQDGGAA